MARAALAPTPACTVARQLPPVAIARASIAAGCWWWCCCSGTAGGPARGGGGRARMHSEREAHGEAQGQRGARWSRTHTYRNARARPGQAMRCHSDVWHRIAAPTAQQSSWRVAVAAAYTDSSTPVPPLPSSRAPTRKMLLPPGDPRCPPTADHSPSGFAQSATAPTAALGRSRTLPPPSHSRACRLPVAFHAPASK
eukprot:354732-Chlamydomonas_euryale.AAC.2